jgi:hypothetical protein
VRPEVLGQLKKLIHLIGSRNRDLAACSVLPNHYATACPLTRGRPHITKRKRTARRLRSSGDAEIIVVQKQLGEDFLCLKTQTGRALHLGECCSQLDPKGGGGADRHRTVLPSVVSLKLSRSFNASSKWVTLYPVQLHDAPASHIALAPSASLSPALVGILHVIKQTN